VNRAGACRPGTGPTQPGSVFEFTHAAKNSVAVAATTSTSTSAVTASTTATSTATTAAVAAPATTAAATESTAATTASATKSTATPSATATAVFFGTGFIDGQGTAIMLKTIQGGDCRSGFVVAGHFNKAESFAATGVAIVDDLSGNNLAMSGKQLLEFRAVDIVTEIPHVQFLTHLISY
jgi:hypothetical protein